MSQYINCLKPKSSSWQWCNGGFPCVLRCGAILGINQSNNQSAYWARIPTYRRQVCDVLHLFHVSVDWLRYMKWLKPEYQLNIA